MGMYDNPSSLTKSEFATGDFILWGGEDQGIHKSADFGENRKATVKVSKVPSKDSDATPNDATEYVVYGVMAEQIARADSDDFGAVNRIGKDGRANVFEFVRKLDSAF